jgi:hypoxanthine phosphoribosyltransferase
VTVAFERGCKVVLETPPQLRIYSWADVVRLTQQLADLLEAARSKPSVVIAILRGGAFPGLVLSHALGIRKFYSIKVSTTLNEAARAVRSVPLVEGVEALPNLCAEHVLMVDDVTNTGDTLTSAVRVLRKLRSPASVLTAAIVWDTVPTTGTMPLTSCAADLWADKIHAWAVFPWETKEGVAATS